MKDERTYTIKQAAEHTGISEDTIRYYEKIKLLPRANRKDNGHRIYREEDVDTLKLISCLKKTGMPLDGMKPFLLISADADPTQYPELVESLKIQRENIVSQIASLQQIVDFIDMRFEEGSYRQECTKEDRDAEAEGQGRAGSQDGAKSRRGAKSQRGEPKPRPVSPAEMSYFSISGK